MYEEKNIKILARFLLYIITFAFVFLYGIVNTYALDTKTIYSVNNNGTLSSANTYNYGYLTGGGTQATARGNINTTISGKAYGFMFLFYESVTLNKTYTLVVNFMDSDLLKTFNSSLVQISTCNGDTCNSNVIVSVVKNNNFANSNKLTIEFNPITNGSFILVNLGGNEPITGISTFGIRSVELGSTNQNQDIINNQTNNTNNIINNNNSNTQDIINNQESNASAIIDNQNQNTQQQIESQQVCRYKIVDYSDGVSVGVLNSDGTINPNSSTYKTTDFIEINDSFIVENMPSTAFFYYCLYDSNKTLSSCYEVRNGTFSVPSSIKYIKVSIRNNNIPVYNIHQCTNGNQALSDDLNNLNDSINDDDVGGATQDGADFILDFDTNTFGLTSIITAPLNLIESLTSSSCSELELPLPFLNNKKLNLPCMTTIYQNTFGTLFTMYQTITFGIIAYWVCVRIFNQVKDFKNPEHDEIEVVDL